MIPTQTYQILLGAATALLYAGVLVAVGFLLLFVSVGRSNITGVCTRVSRWGFLWLCFVVGQGILGVLWLITSLLGILHPSLILSVCISLLFGTSVLLLMLRPRVGWELRSISMSRRFLSLGWIRSWYFWLGVGIFTVSMLRGVIALLPPSVDDAINWYLPVAKVIAESHALRFQPFITPHSGLYPLQVEMHWAALYSISNETAVTVFDYLCALSFLFGIGLLCWFVTSSRRAALLGILMVISMPMFYDMMGGGKVDNAAGQYGVAAFLWMILWPILGRRSAILAGLCMGWALAGRYTNFIVAPALVLFGITMARHIWTDASLKLTAKTLRTLWVPSLLALMGATLIAWLPMLVKNWLLVGCPLAPLVGCPDAFWAQIKAGDRPSSNISVADLFLYPFIMTFARRDAMLGNISPLFMGFFPFLIPYLRHRNIRSAGIVGLAGLVSVIVWLFMEPLNLYPRFFLIPLALIAVPLSAAVVVCEQDRQISRVIRWSIRFSVVVILVLLLFESRAVVYAVRYVASIDSRSAKYESNPGSDVAKWLNTNVQPRQRVALSGYKGARYLVDTNILMNSESAEERQWLWEHGEWRYGGYGSLYCISSKAPLARFYVERGFDYVVVAKDRLADGMVASLSNVASPYVAFLGRKNVVLRTESSQTLEY